MLNSFHSSNSFMNVVLQKASSFWFWAYTATAVFGGVIVWIFGHRGINFFDHSAVFDGGWRILQGQIIYRDFYVPFGPIVYFIQSLFFRMAGVDFSSMVLAAAVLNVVAIVCVMWLVRRLFPDPIHHPTAIAAGLTTAVWFQAPFGTLWFDQASFFFNLIALVLVVEAVFRSERTAVYLRVAAGCSLVISILSKQSGGVLLPGPLGVVLLTSLPVRRKTFVALLQVLAGVVISASLFALWLWEFSSLTGFWQSVVVMSRVLSRSRFGFVSSVTDLIWLRKTRLYAPLVACAVFALSRRLFARANSALIVWIVLSYTFVQNLFASITFRTSLNSLGYLGLIDGLAFGLFSEVFWQRKQPGERPLLYWSKATIPLFSTAFLFYLPISNGWINSATRGSVQPACQGACYDPETRFIERLHVRGASRVIWPEPKVQGGICNCGMCNCGQVVSRKDFEDLNSWLDDDGRNFFVLSTSTLLYGLHQRVSPQPWIYLVSDNSFRLSDVAQVDNAIVESLKKNNVRVVVWEKPSLDGDNEQLLKDMPNLQAWLRNQFQKQREFGPYEVWTLFTGL
jgi:hypothetical protein